MTIRVLLFSVFREKAGVSQLDLQTTEVSTPALIFSEMADKYFPEQKGLMSSTMFAVNESYVEANCQLKNGDVLAFIPPVAGG